MIAIAKSFDFSASHRLFRPDWDEKTNTAVYGKCANPNGHGHNYRLEVVVSGPIDAENGMVFDASMLSEIVEEHVLRDVDHKNLNSDVAWLRDKVPTAEIIVEGIWQKLERAINDKVTSASLEKLILHETSKIYAVRTRDT